MKKIKKKAPHLNLEEEELLSSFEKGEWKTVKNVEKAKSEARATARKLIKKMRASTFDFQVATFQLSNKEQPMKEFPTKP